MKYLCSILGLVIGVLIVRGFMLDNLEEIAWRMFWHELAVGNVGTRDIANASGSATFIKVAIGALLGLVIGGVLGEKVTQSKAQAESEAASTKCAGCGRYNSPQATICEYCGHAIPAAAPPVATTPVGDAKIAQLERLLSLKERGALSEQEFEQEKKRLFGAG